MCRLLAYAAPSEATSAEVIGEPACREWQQLGRLHADGWGTAWLDDGQVVRFRDPEAGTLNPDLTAALLEQRSRARITHLRMATEGMANQIANTHPFQVGEIALAHNGSVHPVDELRAMLRPGELERVGGDTDSAMVFALILRRVDEGSSLFDAASGVVGELTAAFPKAALNLMLLTPDELIAVHSNANAPIPLEDFEASGLGSDLPQDHVDHYYRLSYRRNDDGAIAFTSSGLPSEGWTPMEQRSAVRIDLTSLETEVRSLEPARAGRR